MRTTIICCLLLLAFVGTTGCKTTQLKESPSPQKGMYKVTVLYPGGEGKTFDMDYYEKKHMPMVAGFIGNNLKFYEIEKGIGGRTPEEKAPYMAIGIFYVSDLAAYNASIAKNREAIVNDFSKYTNVLPVVQVSEVTKVVYRDLE
ncbi:MAG: EthD family reductase [Bacteroidetes bacterium]|nr:EthD family reductase [Bacteroidota bacterium]